MNSCEALTPGCHWYFLQLNVNNMAVLMLEVLSTLYVMYFCSKLYVVDMVESEHLLYMAGAISGLVRHGES